MSSELSTALADSDGKAISDANEYAMANSPVSDPCQGPNIQCPQILNRMCKARFEKRPNTILAVRTRSVALWSA